MIPFETVLLRLFLALLFGAAVGVERQWRQKAAGIKTQALVGLGAAGFAIVSNTFGPTNHNPAQIAAAVVSGIGFIGAGVIIHRGATVQGVTTAATLWANASMGLALGIGQYTTAGVLVAGMLVVQFALRDLETRIERAARRGDWPGRFEVRVECDSDCLDAINDTWREFASTTGLVAVRRSIQRGQELLTWRAIIRTTQPGAVDLAPLQEQLVSMPHVVRVELRHLDWEEDVRGAGGI